MSGDTKTYVYLAPCRELEAFKIGISSRPLARFKKFAQEIVLEDVCLLGCPTRETARLIESILHKLCKLNAVELDTKCDGSTEWFDLDFFENVLYFVQDYQEEMLPYETFHESIDWKDFGKSTQSENKNRQKDIISTFQNIQEDNIKSLKEYQKWYDYLTKSDLQDGLTINDTRITIKIKDIVTKEQMLKLTELYPASCFHTIFYGRTGKMHTNIHKFFQSQYVDLKNKIIVLERGSWRNQVTSKNLPGYATFDNFFNFANNH